MFGRLEDICLLCNQKTVSGDRISKGWDRRTMTT